MSTDYTYDDQGQFFPYFVITITGLVTIPLTYSVLKPSQELENTAPRIKTDYKLQDAELVEAQKKKQKRRERKLKRMVASLGGWSVMAWMVYLMVVTARTVVKIWDPYEVLGVSMSSSEKQIKRHYRMLSLTQHPDKVKLDPEHNITSESVNERWVEITKAFKALTDEEVRNNYLQYGHPDGKQSFSIGIALPKLLITEGNGKYVLMIYGILLGVLLPYLVGKWWYGTQRMTREKVLVASAGNLFRDYDEDMDETSLINSLSSGYEYRSNLGGDASDSGLSKLESKLLASGSNTASGESLNTKIRALLRDVDDSVRRKALCLLWAYLRRVDLSDKTLDGEKYDVAPTACHLIESFLATANAFGNSGPVMAAWRTQQLLIQGMPPGASPLLQLPHFDAKIVHAIEGDGAKTHLSLQEYMSISAEKRRKLTVGPGLLSDKQYKQALSVASQLPRIHIEKAFFKVSGERFVLPSSLVQFVIKARIIPPGSRNVPNVDPKDLEDVDPPEGDLDSQSKSKNNSKSADAESEDKADSQERHQPPLSHSPRYARDHSPKWLIFLSDPKQRKVVVPGKSFSTFDKPIFNADGTPTFNMQTIKMQFGAPPDVGTYAFAMHLICDSYVGMDTSLDVLLEVEDISKAEELVEEEDASEPDEDSIAGQMAGLRGQPIKRSKVREALSSDDDSDSAEDEDTDSETDTDTDTESEED